MKHFRIISVLVVCFLTVIGKAQDSTSHLKFFEDGKSWLWQIDLYIDRVHETKIWTETVAGDTIVDGRPAKKILLEGDYNGTKIGLEENGVIYEYGEHPIVNDSICFYPILNFNYNVGDSVFLDKLYCFGDSALLFEVVKDEIINVKGINRRRLGLKIEVGPLLYWVEGIGSESRFSFYLEPMSTYYSYHYTMLKCFNKDGECIFDYDDFFTSTDGIDDVNAGSSDKDRVQDDALYDLSGRRVTGKPRRGIYIKGGQKVLVK